MVLVMMMDKDHGEIAYGTLWIYYNNIIVVEDSLTALLFNRIFPFSEWFYPPCDGRVLRGLLSPFILQRVLIFQEVDFPPEGCVTSWQKNAFSNWLWHIYPYIWTYPYDYLCLSLFFSLSMYIHTYRLYLSTEYRLIGTSHLYTLLWISVCRTCSLELSKHFLVWPVQSSSIFVASLNATVRPKKAARRWVQRRLLPLSDLVKLRKVREVKQQQHGYWIWAIYFFGVDSWARMDRRCGKFVAKQGVELRYVSVMPLDG